MKSKDINSKFNDYIKRREDEILKIKEDREKYENTKFKIGNVCIFHQKVCLIHNISIKNKEVFYDLISIEEKGLNLDNGILIASGTYQKIPDVLEKEVLEYNVATKTLFEGK